MHPGFYLNNPVLLYITQYMNISVKLSSSILMYKTRDAMQKKPSSKSHFKVVTRRYMLECLICNEDRTETC